MKKPYSDLLKKHPDLGIGGYLAWINGGSSFEKCTRQEARDRLLESTEAIAASIAFLQDAPKIKTLTRAHSSYGLKHLVEAWHREVLKSPIYIPNGAFILAALSLDIPVERDDERSPNAKIGISQRWISSRNKQIRNAR